MASNDLAAQAGITDIGALADQLVPPPVNPVVQTSQQFNTAVAQPYIDAYQAVRGRMSEAEARDFAYNAAIGLVPMGRGLMSAVPKAAATAKPVQGIKAYHGSPHDFDKFDFSKIGSGEGVQAYGHGLYFAENPTVAREYQHNLAMKAQDMPQFRASTQLKISGGNRDEAIAELLRDRARFIEGSSSWHESTKAVKLLREGMEVPKGHMYEVNLKANPEDFLQWDKPLSGQPKSLQELVSRGPTRLSGNDVVRGQLTSPDGQAIYQRLRNMEGDNVLKAREAATMPPLPKLSQADAKTSDMLRESGIPGIRYLDQGSRFSGRNRVLPHSDMNGEGFSVVSGTGQRLGNFKTKQEADNFAAGKLTNNYVVFDDSIIDILKKLGIAGLFTGAGAVATTKGNGT